MPYGKNDAMRHKSKKVKMEWGYTQNGWWLQVTRTLRERKGSR